MKNEDIKRIIRNRDIGTIGKHKEFAVLVPIVEINGESHLIFEERSNELKAKDQPGDICFPGGKIEEGESPLAGALRETDEETGIGKEKIRLYGQFDTMYGYSGYTLYSFVGEVSYEDYLCAHISLSEVAELFTVPVKFFLETKPFVFKADIKEDVKDFPYEEFGINRDYYWGKGIVEMPIYTYKGKTIWGITGRISRALADSLK